MQQDVTKTGFEEEKTIEKQMILPQETIKKVTTKMNTIASTTTEEAKGKIFQAIASLNGVTGLQEYVGAVNAEKYQSVFNGINDTITNLAEQLDKNAKEIREENEKIIVQEYVQKELLALLKEKQKIIDEKKEKQRKIEFVIECLKREIEEEEKQRKRIEELEEMIQKQVEEDVKNAAEEERRKHEFSTESLLSGDYFTKLDQKSKE